MTNVMSEPRNFDWQNIYKNMKVTEMPWYSPDLDYDLRDALDKLHISTGAFLDLGTGPASQAYNLKKRGFDVIGTDVAEDAILLAKQTYPDIRFIQDDILETKLTQKYDFIFDRGCFHVLDEDKRGIYVSNVARLLNDKGRLFLKCFSDKMPETSYGPHRISMKMIRAIFEPYFTIEELFDTEFLNEKSERAPKGLFAVMKKR
jgi:SAM-dependent methyltransferase